MPSLVLGQPDASGAILVISGNPWSGTFQKYGITLRWLPIVSGAWNCYISLSGGGPPLSGGFMTVNSGQLPLSGGASSGMLDGMPMAPGDKYYIPALVLANQGGVTSGVFNLYAKVDAGASGVGRLYFEPWYTDGK